MCVCVFCIRQRKIQTIPTLWEPTAPNLLLTTFIRAEQWQTQLQMATCLFFTLSGGYIQLEQCLIYNLVLIFLVSPGQERAAVTCLCVSGVTLVRICHRGVILTSCVLFLLDLSASDETISKWDNFKLIIPTNKKTIRNACLPCWIVVYLKQVCVNTYTSVGLWLVANLGLIYRRVFPAKQSFHRNPD